MEWVGAAEQDLNQGILGSVLVLGMTLGAVGGGKLMSIGRRKALFICIAIGIFGNANTLIFAYYFLI